MYLARQEEVAEYLQTDVTKLYVGTHRFSRHSPAILPLWQDYPESALAGRAV